MKAITIKNPYAHLIVLGIKDIENRTWKTNFRGKVLIHAAATWHKRGRKMDSLFTPDQMEVLMAQDMEKIQDPKMKFSAIVGEVEIVDCVINHPSVWAENNIGIPEDGLIIKPIYNWVLKNPVAYSQPFLDVKGKLSFWEFDPY